MHRHVPNTMQMSRAARTLVGSAVIFAGAVVYAGNAKAQATATQPSTGTVAIPTYEAAGLYWQSPGGTAGCEVKFRKAGATAWQQGLPMWYDARDQQCRGSIVGLTENTEYQVEFNLPGQAPSRGLVVKTWPNKRPIAKTVAVNGGSQTYNITEGGTANGYVVYDGSGATLDGQNSATYNVTINASYVIVRGLNLRGAKQDAIRISPNVTDVIIEDNDISGWGRTRDGKWATDMDSAVRAVCTGPTLQRVVVQRNKMYNPRYSANSWTDGHPAGAQAIAFAHCGGNHVFRHNEMFSTNGNYFNDIIGGEDNFTKAGFPNSDTDIYGNKMSHAWDDGIEAEGANENVRIYNNYIDRTAIGIATTATSVGPIYIFRNVWNRAQMYAGRTDTDDRQPFFKSGGQDTLGYGRRYVFHNTMLQAVQSGAQYGMGGGYGMGGTGSAQLIQNTHSKNNIYHLWKPGKSAFYQTGATNEMAADMYNGTAGDATIAGGINATPTYASGHGWQNEAGGNYQLAAGSAGHGKAVRLPNFNDAYAAADVGAHQSGTGAMAFGIGGSPGNSLGGGVTNTPTTPTTPTTPSTYSLSVTTVGSGSGTVTSSPSGINCGSSCTTTLAAGTSVALTAAPASGSTFAGWSGACSGTGSCTVSLGSNQSVTATFNSTSTSAPPATGGTGVVASTTSLGNFSTSRTQAVTFTNKTAAKVTFLQASMSSAKYGQANNCGEVAVGASCTVNITYYPTNSGSDTGTFTLTSNAPSSSVITLSSAAVNVPSSSGGVAQSASSLSFASTTKQTVTFTNNTGTKVTFMQASMSSGKFSQTNNCGEVAAGGSCTVTITFGAGGSGSNTGTFTLTSSAPNSPHTVSLSGSNGNVKVSANTMVPHFYSTILGRTPDAGGAEYWIQEVGRVADSGADVKEAYFAMAMSFFGSPEYAARARDNPAFLSDLYGAFFNRPADAPGLSYWGGEIAKGMPREVVLASFMFSSEFANFVTGLVGTDTSARAEVDLAMDFYRGLLGRMPDSAGFAWVLGQLRTAQCKGAPAVAAVAESMSAMVAGSPEQASRARSDAQFVGDLYNSVLRRGGDLGGVQHWIGQLRARALTRDGLRRQLLASPEFSARLAAVVAEGCAV